MMQEKGEEESRSRTKRGGGEPSHKWREGPRQEAGTATAERDSHSSQTRVWTVQRWGGREEEVVLFVLLHFPHEIRLLAKSEEKEGVLNV